MATEDQFFLGERGLLAAEFYSRVDRIVAHGQAVRPELCTEGGRVQVVLHPEEDIKCLS